MVLEREQADRLSDNIALTPSEIANRRRLRWVLSKFFRNRIASGVENLEEAAEFVEREGRGVSFRINHFSRSDPIQAMIAATSHPTFANRRIVAPIAAHQTSPKPIRLVEISKNCGVELFPVVTKNTLKRASLEKGTGGAHIGQGFGKYWNRAAELLTHGGIDINAPQGERQGYLEPFDGTPMSTFVQIMRRHGVSNFGVIFVGFELAGVNNYEQVSGLNVCRPYIVHFGKFYTFDSMLVEAGGKIRDLDSWAWRQLASVSSPYYIKDGDN